MGPRRITHTFFFWRLISQLHRTSVTQGFLAGILLCNSGASRRYFLCTCELHTLIVLELIFDYTNISYTNELFPNCLCNHFGHCSKSVERVFRVVATSLAFCDRKFAILGIKAQDYFFMCSVLSFRIVN